MISAGGLRLLFSALRATGYEWQPQTPDRLLSLRKNPDALRPLVQWLGLGLQVDDTSLCADGLPSAVLKILRDERFDMAVSGHGELFVVHDHWPPKGDYVHYAAESAWLARACNRDLEGFVGKRVLDLGCGSGALAFEAGGVAEEAMGLDMSERAIEWARVSARANGYKNLCFEVAAVGTSAADAAVGSKPWDTVLMNPPMVVPAQDASYPHRDGGKLGIEIPFVFLDFAFKHLRVGGEVLCLATNPIVDGRSIFFDRLDKKKWDFLEKRCLHSHFNQTVARKQKYSDQGIERIELWFLHLSKL